MKKILFSLAIALISLTAWSQNWNLINPAKTENPVKKLIDDSPERKIVKFQVNAYSLVRTLTDRGEAFHVNTPKGSKMLEKGNPELPKLSTSLIIPDAVHTEIEVIYQDYIELDGLDIAPSKGVIYRNQNPDDIPYTFGETYQTDAYYPGKLASAGSPYILRNYRGQAITIYPFQYNPVSKTLRIYTDITVEVKSAAGTAKNIRTPNAAIRLTEEFNEIYDRHFLNYSQNRYDPLEEGTPGRMLIISYGDFMDEMQDFVQWKREKGIDTEIIDVDDVGSTSSDIDTYIENQFNANGLNYVLLVGDAGQIPTNTSSDDSDNEYGYILGDDHYIDLFIGRFSAETGAQVTNMVEKIISYERDMAAGNDWLSHAFGSASSEGGDGQGDDGESDLEHINNITTDLENYGYTTTNVNQAGGDDAQISAVLNDGASLINYVGHGSATSWGNTGYSNDDINALTNAGKLPYGWSVACINGAFRGQTCFAEAWLRAEDNGAPTGAVGFLASTINQSWDEPMDGQDEMNDILVESYMDNIKRTFGGLSFNGIFHMLDEYSTSTGQSMADTWTLFGDPSMVVRTKDPAEMTISHADILNLGAESFQLNCDADGALVAATRDNGGETEIMGTGYVAGGVLDLDITPFTEPGTMTLTITAFDKQTYQEDILVIVPDGPYVTLNALNLNDGNEGNGLAEAGESFALDLILENVGVETATAVNAEISTANPAVNFSDDTESIGDIEADNTAENQEAYVLSLEDGIADQSIIMFDLAITDGQSNAWDATSSITVQAPAPKLSLIGVDDAAEGNGNGILDPGETATLHILVQNEGHAEMAAGICDLSFIEPELTVNPDDAEQNTSAIAQDASEEMSFEVTVGPDISTGANVHAEFNLTAGAYSDYLNIALPIGQQMETWESNDFETYNWSNDESIPWIIVDDEVYDGDYSSRSGDLQGQAGVTELSIEVEVITAEELSFFKKVSCEEVQEWSGMEYYWDFLAFYIDGEEQNKWAGEVDWSEESYPISEGLHSFTWHYEKDSYVDAGSDCAWIDNIILPPHQDPVFIAYNSVKIDDYNMQVFPNPASDMSRIQIEIPETSKVQLQLYDLHGRMLKCIMEESQASGYYDIQFPVSQLDNGLYIIRLITSDKTITKRLVVSK